MPYVIREMELLPSHKQPKCLSNYFNEFSDCWRFSCEIVCVCVCQLAFLPLLSPICSSNSMYELFVFCFTTVNILSSCLFHISSNSLQPFLPQPYNLHTNIWQMKNEKKKSLLNRKNNKFSFCMQVYSMTVRICVRYAFGHA